MKKEINRNKIPKIVDGEKYFKYADMIRNLDNIGYLEVEITSKKVLDKINIPENIWKFCEESGLDIDKAINTILRDFVICFYSGKNKYEAGILNRIKTFEMDETVKQNLIKHILQNE